jgi:phenylacetic acid degradation protein paaN
MKHLHERHQATFQQAYRACDERSSWSGFYESPSIKIHGEEAVAKGKVAFEQQLGNSFELDQPGIIERIGYEVSPYTRQPLGIDYPHSETDQLCHAAKQAMQGWRKVEPDTRAAVCIELLKAIERACIEDQHATMHTTGQSFLMSFVGSGANALDRGMEAIVYAHKAMTQIPGHAVWTKQFGKRQISLEKRYHYVPRGVALVIACASFPAWNAYPAIMANLMTGNAVVLKPHPNSILSMAIAVRQMREALTANGIDPNLITLATDTIDKPIAGEYFNHGDVAIVDFTGSQRFGGWLENNVHDKLVYTETSGVNSVIIESTDNVAGMVDAIAHSLCLFSAQMCTAAQNIQIPKAGIETDRGFIPAQELIDMLVAAVDRKTADPKSAAAICATLQADSTIAALDELEQRAVRKHRILRQGLPYQHPDFANARTRTPLMIQVQDPDDGIEQQEQFGPASFVILHDDAEAALQKAAADARQFGAIATYLYSVNNAFIDKAEEVLIDAGASFTCNLTGPMPLNYGAAYSDLHVTGLNPAGNACLADLAFVANRFRIAQCRWPSGTR